MTLRRARRNIRSIARALFVLSVSLCGVGSTAFAQAAGNWSGQVQCSFDDVDQSYSRHELQTWMLTGASPSVQGSMYVYPATWSSTGQGALQRVQGAQTTNIQWTTNVPAQQATIAIFVRASDNRLIIKPWHSQMRLDYAVTGSKQIVTNGVAQQPTSFSYAAWEWQFPRIEDSPTNANVTGSSQSQADGGNADLVHRNGGIPLAANCQWQFTKGGMTPTNSNQMGSNAGSSNQNQPGSMAGSGSYQGNGQNCESPASVQQSFENMKSNLQTQYNQLIQGTSDPAQVASLTSQEQRMLANLNSQEQHDVAAASQGCVQATNQNTNGGTSFGSNQSPNNSRNNPYSAGQNSTGQYSGNNQNYGSNQYSGNNSNPGGNSSGNQNYGNNQYPGNGQNSGNNQGQSNTQSSNTGNNGMGSSTQNGTAGSNGQPPPAQLLSLNPSSVNQGSTMQVNLAGQGTHWTNATNVSFGSQITVQSFTADPSGTSAVATINVASSASPGSRPVMLMSGAEMVGLPSGLTVTAAPTQTGSTASGSTISKGIGLTMPTHSALTAGLLTGVSPASNNGQQNLTVTLTGERTNFASGATTVKFIRAQQAGSTALNAQLQNAALAMNTNTPPPLQTGPISVSSTTIATVSLTINPAAAAGTYNITVTTPAANGTETVTLNNAFTVTTAPSLSVITAPPAITQAGSITAPPTSGNYRVTMTGLMCARAITGGGDAIYGAAVIRQYDRRSNQSTMFTNANTWVYGDTNGYIAQRKQAGTRGPQGGIGAGNFVPDGFIFGPRDTLPPQPNVFPMALWQGTLTNGVDALVISPSLWISYGDNSMFFNWNQNEDSFTNSILLDPHVQTQIKNNTFGALVFGTSQNVSGSAAASLTGAAAVAATEELVQASGLTFGIPIGVFAITGPSHDRPIGVAAANPSDPTSNTVLPNATLVLTREIIEKQLGSSAWTTMTFNFIDDPLAFSQLPNTDRPGQYSMFIQIERQ
jgi:hypothetical protein